MNMNPSEILKSLMPMQKLGIMNLVREAGVNVSPWAITKSGESVAVPQANPQFCYEWAFGGKGEPIVLCIWHANLKPYNDSVAFLGNYRKLYVELDRIALDRTYEKDIRSRAKSQAQRALLFDVALQNAYRLCAPVRVVVVHGQRRDDSALGMASSEVEFRKLDDSLWWTHDYSSESDVLLLRNIPLPLNKESVLNLGKKYVDQFDVNPARRGDPSTQGGYIRSQEFRAIALDRAKGKCELCGQLGFETKAGELYLETHHIVPLSEDGADHPDNLVALCAHDHRRAHYSLESDSLRAEFLAMRT